MKIIKATVLLTDEADRISLRTNLPSAIPKLTDEPLSLYFQTERNIGLDYLMKYFNLELKQIEIINCR